MYRRNLITGLSVLAIIAAAAVSVPAAHAQGYDLKLNGNYVKTLQLERTVLLKRWRIPFVLTIHCPGGTELTTILDVGTTLLTGTQRTSAGCKVVSFGSCTVHSEGAADGTIVYTGQGEGAAISGSTVSLEIESEEFTVIEILGALCPFSELIAAVSGSETSDVLNATTETASKAVHIDELALFFGEEELLFDGPEEAPAGLSHVKSVGGGIWSIVIL